MFLLVENKIYILSLSVCNWIWSCVIFAIHLLGSMPVIMFCGVYSRRESKSIWMYQGSVYWMIITICFLCDREQLSNFITGGPQYSISLGYSFAPYENNINPHDSVNYSIHSQHLMMDPFFFLSLNSFISTWRCCLVFFFLICWFPVIIQQLYVRGLKPA